MNICINACICVSTMSWSLLHGPTVSVVAGHIVLSLDWCCVAICLMYVVLLSVSLGMLPLEARAGVLVACVC